MHKIKNSFEYYNLDFWGLIGLVEVSFVPPLFCRSVSMLSRDNVIQSINAVM